ncbi:MAG: hypothetical protein WKG07_05425 [Hymenobacter sp.]
MKELEPLTQPINHFPRAPDAAYLYAVAATRAGQWAEAEQMLNLIRNQYLTYPGLNEVLYLQGQVLFEQNDYDTALRTPGSATRRPLRPRPAKRHAGQLPSQAEGPHHLAAPAPSATPKSALLGRLYADFLVSSGPPTPADRQQLDALITQFKLDRQPYAAGAGCGLGRAQGAAPQGYLQRRGATAL